MCVHVGTRLLFSQSIALAYVRHRGPEAWQSLVELSGARFLSGLAHREDEASYVVALQDLRHVTPLDWMARFNERTAVEGWGEAVPPTGVGSPLAALAEDDFAARVREALRSLNEPLLLEASPLLHSGALRDAAGSPRERATALRARLVGEIQALRGSPRGDSWHRVLDATYVRGGEKHEQVASDLGMSYTTFRRVLRGGTQRIVAALWSREQE
jgi:hypothetical protein